MYRSLFVAAVAVIVALVIFIWASDRITMEGNRTVYTVICQQGTWDGLRCNGKMVVGDRHRFHASRSRNEVVYWVAGSSKPSGKFTECDVTDRDHWACKTHEGDQPTIAHELAEGKPVRHAGSTDMPFHAVTKWKWWIIDAGIPGFRKADYSDSFDPHRVASRPASAPAANPPAAPAPAPSPHPLPRPRPSDTSMSDAMPETTVLFADVCGSTRLYETLGDNEALATIGRCVALIGTVSAGHGGRLVKTIGDEAMVVFSSADQAAQAAAEMQARVSEQPPVGGSRLAIRVGFHHGPIIEVEGDVFGDAVNVAARMASLAKREQIITTASTADALAPWLRERVREVDTLTVKGKAKDMGVFELLWQDEEADLTAVATRWKPLPARIVLRHGERELVLEESATTITFGRDTQNDIVIGDRKASRLHARMERRRDKFVIVDQSSNGTYVTIDGEPEIMLRREELILRNRGSVSFGHSRAEDPTEVLAFSCVD